MLSMELGILDKKFLEDLNINEEELTMDDIEELESKTTAVSKDAVTEKVTENNLPEKSTNSYKSVLIKNESKYEITEEILTPNIEIKNKKDIFIYHTHTCESYTPSEGYNYEMTGNYRTTNLDYSVARVGRELSEYLKSKGFNVTHDETYHDYPTYSGSYDRSLVTAQNNLAGKDTQIVIDLHRDAVGSNNTYGPTVKINGELAAQMMFVIGTDGGGLEHPNWQQNLKMAVKIQQKANEMYPDLFRPIIVRNSRYNQQVTTGAFIIEVGATGNTLDQCILSMRIPSKCIRRSMQIKIIVGAVQRAALLQRQANSNNNLQS